MSIPEEHFPVACKVTGWCSSDIENLCSKRTHCQGLLWMDSCREEKRFLLTDRFFSCYVDDSKYNY